MKKVLLIGWKDVTLAFRDRAALILMLAAPFILTLGLGFVAGRFSGADTTGVGDIPVVLVNQDGGPLGGELVALFQSAGLDRLLEPALLDDPAQARQQVDADRAAAAVLIPAGFSESIMGMGSEAVPIAFYANAARPANAGVVRTILDRFLDQVEVGRVAGQVVVGQLLAQGLIGPQQAAAVGAEVGARQAQAARPIALRSNTASGEAVQFDILAYMAPGMALMFLMFTVTNGGRALLAERAQGTLPRLLVSPTTSAQVLGGKLFGIYLTGLAQMLILIVASTLLFRLNWGDPLAVLLLVLAAVVGAVGWGTLLTALAKTPGQVSAIGSALMLTFGILGGSFIDVESMPRWFAMFSKITPNAWGLEGFTTLGLGGGLADILTPVLALLAMGGLLFSVAVVLINRRGLARA